MFEKIDMHVHTGRYDGEGSPIEIVDRATKVSGLKGVVLLDHDMLPPYEIENSLYNNIIDYGKSVNMVVSTAVEVTAETHIENVHVLWYNFLKNEKTCAYFKKANQNKQDAYQEMCGNLSKNGYEITYDELQKENTIVSRLDILNNLIKKGYANSLAEAKSLLEDEKNIAYVSRNSVSQIVEMIRDNNGIAILAHPMLICDRDRERIICEAITAGISGFELFYPYIKNGYGSSTDLSITYEFFNLLYKVGVFRRGNFVFTGGSDYHGNKKKEVGLGEAYIGIEQYLYYFMNGDKI
ncbi:MAG: hypothetical protein LBQ15_07515 [Clostridium sp.]|jgi:predicted metal-dependent phosphoesterase TrpH|nr:hypothetical protein [Clostridium sp.]